MDLSHVFSELFTSVEQGARKGILVITKLFKKNYNRKASQIIFAENHSKRFRTATKI